ncbi:MAG: hypothetical protein H6757_04125 [Candidatus Omnitrophica bacterium]|nr:hypothetical protein [Candidatus Omnitrophota bacterium]
MTHFSHWTPRYVACRIFEMGHRLIYSQSPWLTWQVNYFLNAYLKETDKGFEIGSGFSTLWFAKRVGHLTSIEGNLQWFNKIQKLIRNRGVDNITYHLVDEGTQSFDDLKRRCVEIIENMPDALDFGLSDGLCRALMAEKIADKLKPGGVLIVDDINWFLPSNSKTPWSRSIQDGIKNDDETGEWQKFYDKVKDWHVVWTSNGVKDTALYFKPC